MLNVVVSAKMTEAQLEALKANLASQGLTCNFIVEEIPTHTPITGELMDRVAAATDTSVLEIARTVLAEGVVTAEQALEITGLRSVMKEILVTFIEENN